MASWGEPSQPGLLLALRNSIANQLSSASSYGPASNSYVVPTLGETVWIVINDTNGDHPSKVPFHSTPTFGAPPPKQIPVHLHGHHFSILYKGYEDFGSMVSYKSAIAAGKLNPDNPRWLSFRDAVTAQTPDLPPRRDTILAEKFQLLVIAFVADNPGVWALHCHNDFHSSSGMMKQVVEAPGTLRQMVGTYDPPGPGSVPSQPLVYTAPAAGAGGGGGVDETVVQGVKRNLMHCYGLAAMT